MEYVVGGRGYGVICYTARSRHVCQVFRGRFNRGLVPGARRGCKSGRNGLLVRVGERRGHSVLRVAGRCCHSVCVISRYSYLITKIIDNAGTILYVPGGFGSACVFGLNYIARRSMGRCEAL